MENECVSHHEKRARKSKNKHNLKFGLAARKQTDYHKNEEDGASRWQKDDNGCYYSTLKQISNLRFQIEGKKTGRKGTKWLNISLDK